MGFDLKIHARANRKIVPRALAQLAQPSFEENFMDERRGLGTVSPSIDVQV